METHEESTTTWIFQQPRKYIHDEQDIEAFARSLSFHYIVNFIQALGSAVQGCPVQNPLPCTSSAAITHFLTVLDKVDALADEVEPVKGDMRFGNTAFRTWVDRWVQSVPELLQRLIENIVDRKPQQGHETTQHSKSSSELPVPLHLKVNSVSDCVKELSQYAFTSFGDKTRIDYGSGHELNFVALLFCLFRIGYFSTLDFHDVVNVIFARYITCARRLQERYCLEPAGSRGSWGLDDFHFLPFLFGAAQLSGQTLITPDQIKDRDTVDRYSEKYFYFDAIKWILQTKVGAPFYECAPLLCDISAVPTWSKIYGGLVKMYMAEVLKKQPIIQHFHFGSLLPPPSVSKSSGKVEIPFRSL